ncbi:UMP-CMP kinase 2, mitochondrial [Pyrgilauda ruficollis]|uniref:UMP-CMP kinase 2, mitochondrial n=1 Tax=Pyrgilauda ruficollis TaxID=221976 RepID=UPI001B87DF2D|nr:UMP-CMP kinase 2, mitochondrial [Pyrgilauda ruficollis]
MVSNNAPQAKLLHKVEHMVSLNSRNSWQPEVRRWWLLIHEDRPDSATRARGNVALYCWRAGRPDPEAGTFHPVIAGSRAGTFHPVIAGARPRTDPAGPNPCNPVPVTRGGEGRRAFRRAAPCSEELSRPDGPVSFPAGSSSASARPLRSAAGPARCSLLPAPGSLLPAPGSRLPAMLGRCAPGSPGPRPVVRALPPSASALRQRLRQCAERIPEAEAVLDLLEKCPEHQKKGGFPVIVFEGLDATGKTTVTQAVKDTLNGVLLRSPPACISQWRTVFDDEPTPVKRAFYAAGNYILASEIAKASTQAPVIIDRYWHSTAAYAIATETSGKVQDLPPAQDEVYQWPDDLLKPDLVLLLTVDPEERVRRLQHRGLEKTKEEAELEANSLFRQRVEESYRRMVNPACQEVDASPSKEEVLKTVLQVIKKHCAF